MFTSKMTTDDKKFYREMIQTMRTRLTEIRDELSALEIRKADLHNEWENVNAAISKFLPLAGQPIDPNDLSQLGFTDAIKTVLILNKERMSPMQIKEGLASRGFPVSRYSDVMASIYKILSRLKDDGSITVETAGFNVFYRPKRLRRLGRRRLRRVASPQNSETKGAGNESQPTATKMTE